MVSGIVVAGGASRRMGRNKAWVELDGKPMIVRVIDALRHVCSEIVIVGNDFERLAAPDVRLACDEFPGTGALGGLYTGLKNAENELAVAVACDMPFLNPQVLQALISFSFGYDIVIPSLEDERKEIPRRGEGQRETAKKYHLHPLHAVYRKTCLEPMLAAVGRNDLRMISFHDDVRLRIIPQTKIDALDPEHLSVWNVNTPQELERAQGVARISKRS